MAEADFKLPDYLATELQQKVAAEGSESAKKWILQGHYADLQRPVKNADFINEVHATTNGLLQLLATL